MTRALTVLLLAALASCAGPRAKAPAENQLRLAVEQTPAQRAVSEAVGSRYMISTQGQAATRAAREIFRQGGNIIDAAVAASFTIAVERPHSTGLGGGGFFLYREGKTGKVYALDFRERAPARAKPDLFLDERGEVVPKRSTDGILAVGVPGLVAGLTELHERFGRLPLARLLEPAIHLAEEGFPIYPTLAHALKARRDVLAANPASRRIFLRPDGSPWQLGERLVQKDLGKTLRRLARKGRAEFYHGELAHEIDRESRRLGGILTARDLGSYRPRWREPITADYKGYRVYAMPPPSSGGTHVLEILRMLEGDPLARLGPLSTEAIHLEASAMQLAFADRARYMGDPEFVRVPVTELISPEYAKRQRARIPENRALRADEVTAGSLSGNPRPESPQTTHFSIIDAEGDMVASTQTINGLMGSGVVVPGTGIVLNDEMDDFAAKPGAANLFGAIGGEANEIAPGKTPLSSMAPTLITRAENGEPVLSLGAPGGTRIITCVAQVLLDYLEFKLPLYEAVSAVRFHDQWKPDLLQFESPGPAPGVYESLRRMGYPLETEKDLVFCRIMAVAREGANLRGVSDPRDAGSSAGE